MQAAFPAWSEGRRHGSSLGCGEDPGERGKGERKAAAGRVPKWTSLFPDPFPGMKGSGSLPSRFHDMRKEGTFVRLPPPNQGGVMFRTPIQIL